MRDTTVPVFIQNSELDSSGFRTEIQDSELVSSVINAPVEVSFSSHFSADTAGAISRRESVLFLRVSFTCKISVSVSADNIR